MFHPHFSCLLVQWVVDLSSRKYPSKLYLNNDAKTENPQHKNKPPKEKQTPKRKMNPKKKEKKNEKQPPKEKSNPKTASHIGLQTDGQPGRTEEIMLRMRRRILTSVQNMFMSFPRQKLLLPSQYCSFSLNTLGYVIFLHLGGSRFDNYHYRYYFQGTWYCKTSLQNRSLYQFSINFILYLYFQANILS